MSDNIDSSSSFTWSTCIDRMIGLVKTVEVKPCREVLVTAPATARTRCKADVNFPPIYCQWSAGEADVVLKHTCLQRESQATQWLAPLCLTSSKYALHKEGCFTSSLHDGTWSGSSSGMNSTHASYQPTTSVGLFFPQLSQAFLWPPMLLLLSLLLGLLFCKKKGKEKKKLRKHMTDNLVGYFCYISA